MTINIKQVLILVVVVQISLFAAPAFASVGNWSNDPFALREYVNSQVWRYGYTSVPTGEDGGAMNYDNATALKICQMAGFDAVESMGCVSTIYQGRCGWHSCGDNTLAKWNSSRNDFDIINACNLGNVWLSSLKCKNTCTSHSAKQCVGNSVYWFNSCGAQEELYQACTTNQICQNAQCVDQTINCSSNSDCGTNGYTGSPYCQGNAVYQDYKTYTCNNPGTTSSYCSNSTVAQLKNTCTANQVCQNGQCVNNCTQNATKQCVGNAVYWFDSCGTQGSLYQQCSTNQTCSNGTCQNNQCIPLSCSSYNNVALNKSATATRGYVIGFEPSKAVDGNPLTSWNTNPYVADANPADLTITLQGGQSVNSYSISCEGAYGGSAGTIYFYNSNNQVVSTKSYSCAYGRSTSGSFSSEISVAKVKISAYSTGDNVSVSEFSLNNDDPVCGTHSDGCGSQIDCGQCPTAVCSSTSDCGTNGYTGSPYCQGNAVYQDYKTYTCNNPGTTSSYCSNSTVAQLKNTCTANQVCQSGSCVNQTINCSTNADCGTNSYTGSPFCQGNAVYQNYKTYTCNNPGTSTSYCSDSTAAQKKNDCTSNQICTNGSCTDQTINCSTNADCGTNSYTGSPFCQGNNVYQNYITYTCNNAGTSTSYCSSSTASQLKTTCSGSQICSNGSCNNQNITCTSNSDCGTNSYTGSPFCQGNNVYQNYITYTCNNAGTSTSYCSSSTNSQLKDTCSSNQTCSNGSCSGQNCTWHSYQQCSGNYLYWYDSCGNQQDSQYCQNGCYNNTCQNQTYGSLIVNKTVRNLTTGNSGFSNSIYANPGDTLMFMITVQSSGNQSVQNVYIRDNMPANLIYKNQLVVSGTSNYSGDIISGLNVSTVSNQTITITYQAQVAPAQNFSYGTTTLTNSVTITSSNSGSTPTASASVMVTRTAVYGASSISTGLTNNFLVDSFLLPLMLALAGIWMFKVGMFSTIENWLYGKKKNARGFKAERELSRRILEIKRAEQI